MLMGRGFKRRIMSALLALVMAVSMIVISPNADKVEAASATLQYTLTGSTKNPLTVRHLTENTESFMLTVYTLRTHTMRSIS